MKKQNANANGANQSESAQKKIARFHRLAGKRTTRIVNLLKSLRNCANTNAYTYNQKQVEFMFKAIDTSLARTKSVFTMKPSEKKAAVKKVNAIESIFDKM